jgi:peroxiredoxin
MKLAAQLSAFREGLMDRLCPAEAALMREAEAALAASGPAARALQVGMTAPDFTLADQHGRTVRLEEARKRGPVAVVFVRGDWCPFCALTLRAYQAVAADLCEAGCALLAITPQPADACGHAADCHMLAYPVLSDPGNRVGDAFGVTYEVPACLHPLYRRMGHDLPRVNRTGDWRVPLPACFVIGRDGRIAAAHVDPALHRRMEPAALVAAARAAA